MRLFLVAPVMGAAFVGAAGFASAQTPVTVYPDWQGKTEYVVPNDQTKNMLIDTLYIPKGHTLRFAKGTTEVSWSVTHLKLEEDTTIDLTALQDRPAKAGPGGSISKQASYCAPGAAGGTGEAGAHGKPGISLSLHDLADIDNRGSLWIKTDGGPGGDGGNGGNGQMGGGPRKNVLNKRCGAGPGGAAGSGGAGGAGGLTSTVVISLKGSSAPSNFPTGVAPACGLSARPSGLTGKVGIIQAWGGAGCSGAAGVSGQPGKRG